MKQAKQLREESEKAAGHLKKEDIVAILSEKTEKRKSLKVSLTDDVAEKLSSYNVKSDKVIGDIISIYLDMLERGEVEDVFEDKNEIEE